MKRRDFLTLLGGWAEGRYERLPAMAADLVRRPVSLIAANAAAIAAAKAATTSIPIVFQTGSDPVAAGLVNRPGGNLTGISTLGGEVGPKRLELLRELLPAASSIAVLANRTSPINIKDLQTAAHTFGLQLHIGQASTEGEFETAFATFVGLGAGGLVIVPDGSRVTSVCSRSLTSQNRRSLHDGDSGQLPDLIDAPTRLPDDPPSC